MEVASFVISCAQSIVQSLQNVRHNEVEAKALSLRIVTIADLVDQFTQQTPLHHPSGDLSDPGDSRLTAEETAKGT
jgi:hypothetical protein